MICSGHGTLAFGAYDPAHGFELLSFPLAMVDAFELGSAWVEAEKERRAQQEEDRRGRGKRLGVVKVHHNSKQHVFVVSTWRHCLIRHGTTSA